MNSRPDPNSNGQRWLGDNADGSNRFTNYVRRMAPHVVGFIPYASAWAVLFSTYTNTISDVQEAFDVNDEVPAYILSAISSTFAIFSTFTATQIYFQWQPPSKYFKSEPVYCVLSATSKTTLGLVLIANVIRLNVASDGAAG